MSDEAGDALDALGGEDFDAFDGDQFDLAALVDEIEDLLASLIDDAEESSSDELVANLRRLAEIIDAVETVLETVDVDELPDTINFEELPEVVNPEELPEAIEDDDYGDVIEATNLRKLIEFSELWDAVDTGTLLTSRDELSDAADLLTGDDDDGGLLGDDEDGGLLGDDEDDGEFLGVDADEMTDEMAEGFSDGMGALENPETIEVATQAKLDDAVSEFRDVLISTHARLDRLREENERRIEGIGQPKSRNPSAVSTLATHRGAPKGAERMSTVPRRTRHSSGPSRKRIYGSRFKQMMEEENEDTGSTEERSGSTESAGDEPESTESADGEPERAGPDGDGPETTGSTDDGPESAETADDAAENTKSTEDESDDGGTNADGSTDDGGDER